MIESIEKIGELILVDHKTLPVLFSEGKADSIVDEIEKKVRSFVPDMKSEKGRKDIASLAYKIARSKTLLDIAGKELTADWKAKARLVDQERSMVWRRLESLQEEIRRPLTEYENSEKARKDEHQDNLSKFKTICFPALVRLTIDELEKAIQSCDDLLQSRDWQEFKPQAEQLHKEWTLTIKEKISTVKLYIETKKREEAERKLKEEQEKREREERIAMEKEERKARLSEEIIKIEKIDSPFATEIPINSEQIFECDDTTNIIEMNHNSMKVYIIVDTPEYNDDEKTKFVGKFVYKSIETAKKHLDIYNEHYYLDNYIDEPVSESDYFYKIREIEVIE